jgi:uncharacterized protein (DUF362 family)
MKKDERDSLFEKRFSRRNFLALTGATAAGLLIPPFNKSKGLFAFPVKDSAASTAKVAATQAFNYDRAVVKQRVQHLFESLGGIGDVIKPGDKAAIKINLTGGTSYDNNALLNGVSMIESVWTHPEVLRAVGELILDSGVNAKDLYIVEAIWDNASYNNYGYSAVQKSLGCQLVNLNSKSPYSDFIDKPVGDNHYYYSSFKLNRILDEVNAFVSIPKMKQHLTAGITHSMKNLIGIVPLTFYGGGWRSQLHNDGGNDPSTHLPRSICDLNMARPIHLAVIDGIKNAEGGELPTSVTFHPAEYHLLLASKDPVALDSIAALQMGNDPEAEKLQVPGDGLCDNYLYLAHQKGMGTNVLSEIEVVGDGAGSIKTTVQERRAVLPEHIQLSQNFPNPFNASTTIRYYLPGSSKMTLKMFDSLGGEVATLVDGTAQAGEHQYFWTAGNLPSGIYYCRLQSEGRVETRKLLLQK